VHRLRARVDAILTGIGTVLADDPLLTARGVEVRRVAKRVVVDTDLRLPEDSALVRTALQMPTIVACGEAPGDSRKAFAREHMVARGVTIMDVPTKAMASGQPHVDLKVLLGILSRDHGVATVMVEAGPTLIRSLFRGNLVDEAVVYLPHSGPEDERVFAAAVGRVAPKLRNADFFSLWRAKPLDGDFELTYRRT
jgi:diaminohydroxyphosphoribosylaminopyrimidine deaminase/5-amino-6-(5-phosphoribosylamino)uracil reductase